MGIIKMISQYEVLSFDCYGTLIDWESGILSAIKPVLSSHHINLNDEGMLEIYAELESEAEAGQYMRYREILRKVMHGLGQRLGFVPTSSELDCLVDSLRGWKPFPDTVEALQTLKKSFRLAVISNVDLDLFGWSAKHLKVDFDWVITSEQVKSYKPALQNFKYVIEHIGIPPAKILHIAQSLYHDVVPARTMGLPTVWVNRRKGKGGSGATPSAKSHPDLEVPDLKTLVSMIHFNSKSGNCCP